MKKDELQKEVRDRIVAELENEAGEASVARMQELSRKVLELTDGDDGEVPDEDVERLLAEYPEFKAVRGGTEGPESGMDGMGGMRR